MESNILTEMNATAGGEPPDPLPEGANASQPASALRGWQGSGQKPILKLVRKHARALFPVSDRARLFLKTHYADVTESNWNDWIWQFSHRITTFKRLNPIMPLLKHEEGAFYIAKPDAFPIAITPYYLSLMASEGPELPLRKSVVPTISEGIFTPGESGDPLGEDHDCMVPGLVHRYPDRVLFLVSDTCSVYCRYCTRSRIFGKNTTRTPGKKQWTAAIDYIRTHPVVRDVLLSGGDPLVLSDETIEWLLKSLRKIPHVEIVRIGTKVPAVVPQRITPALIRILKRYHPLWMSLHFTHADELTPETAEACRRLADAGIPLGSQTVLLAGINDTVESMIQLFHGLLRLRVRPYYLYQCDPIFGSAHFRTSIAKGLEIMEGLRGHTSGYAVPYFVIDAPGGGGKIPLLPQYVKSFDANGCVLRNYENETFVYPEFKQ